MARVTGKEWVERIFGEHFATEHAAHGATAWEEAFHEHLIAKPANIHEECNACCRYLAERREKLEKWKSRAEALETELPGARELLAASNHAWTAVRAFGDMVQYLRPTSYKRPESQRIFDQRREKALNSLPRLGHDAIHQLLRLHELAEEYRERQKKEIKSIKEREALLRRVRKEEKGF